MKGKEKQQGRLMISKKMREASSSSSDDEDSDAEKNFALLSDRQAAGLTEEGEQSLRGEEEEDDASEEEEEGSDGGGDEEEESDGSDSEADVGEEEEEVEGDEEEDDDGGDSEDSEGEDSEDDDDDDDEDLEMGGGSSGPQTREDIQKELSSMSFEDIMKLQSKVGTKVYNEVAYGSSSANAEAGKKKRLNKNRPTEISAKKPAPFLRQVVPVRKPTLRDPRFDDLSGEFKPEIFEKTFKFIDDIKHREKEIVKKQLKKAKGSNARKEKLQFLLKRMENQERARLSREQQRERELRFKRQQREQANQGARPFFLKKSEKKKLQLAEKYEELKRSGKLENFLSKKRKRNAGKDRRKLPRQLHKEAA